MIAKSKSTSRTGFSRRGFLQGFSIGTGALASAALFGVNRAFAQEASGTNDDLQTIINVAATAELFATTHYLAAINGDLGLAERQVDYLYAAFVSEQDHYDLLVSLGAVPVVTEFYVPENLFTDRATFAAITEVAENAFIAAYLAATRIFAEASEAAFAVTTTQIVGVESEHRAFIRQIGELLPNDRSYEAFLFPNPSDAVPTLQPFLDGSGEGFVGPVAPPSADEITMIRARAAELGYDSSILPYAAMATMMSGASGVMVMAGAQNVNVRSEPSTSSSVMMTLNAGAAVGVDGQRTVNGFVWWHVVGGGWIRQDAVTEGDGTDGLPEM